MSTKPMISYSEDDVNKLAATNRLNAGWYKFKVQFPTSGVNEKSGNYFIKFVCAPLADPKDSDSARGPTVSNQLTLPISNKEVEGHQAPNTGGICHAALCALYPTHPRMPKKGDDGSYYSSDGELLEDYDAVEEAKGQVARATLQKLVELYSSDGDELEDKTFFGLVGLDATGEFVNIKKMSHELPADAKLVELKDFVVAKPKKSKEAEAPVAKAEVSTAAKPKRRS
jgi:hypothetical protein